MHQDDIEKLKTSWPNGIAAPYDPTPLEQEGIESALYALTEASARAAALVDSYEAQVMNECEQAEREYKAAMQAVEDRAVFRRKALLANFKELRFAARQFLSILEEPEDPEEILA